MLISSLLISMAFDSMIGVCADIIDLLDVSSKLQDHITIRLLSDEEN